MLFLKETKMPTESPTVIPSTTSQPTSQACPYFNLVNSTNNKVVLAAMTQTDFATKRFAPMQQRSWKGKSSSLTFLGTCVSENGIL